MCLLLCLFYHCKFCPLDFDSVKIIFSDNSVGFFLSEDKMLSLLTLKVLVAAIDAQWEGMGDVGSARYEAALLPPMPDHKGFKLQ